MNTNLDPAASQRDPAKTPNVSELPIEVQGRADPFMNHLTTFFPLGEIAALTLKLEPA